MGSRRTSLFALEHTCFDQGVSVVCHADHPRNEFPVNVKYEEKTESTTFNDDIVRHLIREVLAYHLKGIEYRKREGDEICSQVIEDLRTKLSVLNYSEYKIICTCAITSIDKPPLWLESGCTWNDEVTNTDKDRFVEVVYKNKEFYAVATVFGVFNEKLKTN